MVSREQWSATHVYFSYVMSCLGIFFNFNVHLLEPSYLSFIQDMEKHLKLMFDHHFFIILDMLVIKTLGLSL